MKMKISIEWLNEKKACSGAVKEFSKQNETDSKKILLEMIRQKKYLNWGNWLIVRTMTKPQYLEYAIFAAEQVLDIFEKKYPDDKRPRLAIEAAKAVLKNDSEKTAALNPRSPPRRPGPIRPKPAKPSPWRQGVKMNECWWSEDSEDSGIFSTGCGNHFVLNEGTPEENKFKFCCFCGGVLKQELCTDE